MEVMEDGNLMDKVHILIVRDLEYYKNKQSVLQETICPGIAGGRLDFPRFASFAAIKLVLWWEDEFVAGFRRNSGLIPKVVKCFENTAAASDPSLPIVKTSDPDKFICSVAKSGDQLLEHLHVLTQEALDHADLTVLMGTIGAAALIKNCLWFYIQKCTSLAKNIQISTVQTTYKQYQEMTEALAERLLDMHCRLLSLYILQDAESLDWENSKPFFESERGSYIIQMWWMYMQGTKEDLWNRIPPKMAQRVLAGMLNESLTILTVRYIQLSPSETRSKLYAVDLSNLLLCIAQLLPCICSAAEEVVGLALNSQNKIVRDIHSKCQELFMCLLIRGTPLNLLYKVFRKGVDSVEIFRSRSVSISPWITIGLPHVLPQYPINVTQLANLEDNAAISLEVSVLLAQPQPNWALLIKVLGMRNGKLLSLLLNVAMKKSLNCTHSKKTSIPNCDGFLCLGDESCRTASSQTYWCTSEHYYDLVVSITQILLCVGSNVDFSLILISCIDDQVNWAHCLDRQQVWNLNNPPWYKSLLLLIKPFLDPIIPIVISAVQTGASMYQAMTIILACIMQLWDTLDSAVPRLAFLLQDVLPADIVPLGKSVLLQILVSCLYEQFINKSNEIKKEVKFASNIKDDHASESTNTHVNRETNAKHKGSICSFDGTQSSEEAIVLAIAEALCSIDEDNKHTEEINELLHLAQQSLKINELLSDGLRRVEQDSHICEILVSDLLMTADGTKSLKTIYHFIVSNCDWLFQTLGINKMNKPLEPNRAVQIKDNLLHIMFHVGYQPFDQLLSNEWQPDWCSLFNIPMGFGVDRIWNQISLRWEFKCTTMDDLSCHDSKIVDELIILFRQI